MHNELLLQRNAPIVSHRSQNKGEFIMLIWGVHPKSAVVAHADEQYCASCGGDRPFSVYLDYIVRHLYYLLRIVTGKSYTLACATCGQGQKIDAKEIEPTLAKPPISWFDRFGWTIGVGVIAAAVLGIVLLDRQNSAENVDYAAAPQVGDLYVMDLAKGVPNPERPKMYTLGRLTQVSDGAVTIELGRVYFDQERGVRDDISDRKYQNAGYFGTDVATVPAATITVMQADGALIDIERP
jgi:hypothetical protein